MDGCDKGVPNGMGGLCAIDKASLKSSRTPLHCSILIVQFEGRAYVLQLSGL